MEETSKVIQIYYKWYILYSEPFFWNKNNEGLWNTTTINLKYNGNGQQHLTKFQYKKST